VEEVDCEHGGGLRAQEPPPIDVGVPHRRRWDAVALQDPPDGRGADAMAELEQLALQPLVSPARVLPRHPHHQGGEDVVDRWPVLPGSGRSIGGARGDDANAGSCPE
jgi:hypothetical protein